jgi:hypothetical protein
VGPAGAAVGLISDVGGDDGALRPVGSDVEGGWERHFEGEGSLWSALVGPFWIHDGSHHLLDVFDLHAGESGVHSGDPGGLWVAVDGGDDGFVV